MPKTGFPPVIIKVTPSKAYIIPKVTINGSNFLHPIKIPHIIPEIKPINNPASIPSKTP